MYTEENGKPSSTQDHSTSKKAIKRSTSSRDVSMEDELPLWWKILLGILEFGIEVSSSVLYTDKIVNILFYCLIATYFTHIFFVDCNVIYNVLELLYLSFKYKISRAVFSLKTHFCW